MNRTRQLLSLLALVALAVSTTGCNTVEGAGKDIERAGEEIQDTSRDARN